MPIDHESFLERLLKRAKHYFSGEEAEVKPDIPPNLAQDLILEVEEFRAQIGDENAKNRVTQDSDWDVQRSFQTFPQGGRRKEEPHKMTVPIKSRKGCVSPTLKCDSVSASKSKCGFPEFTSPSTPPKLYLTKHTVRHEDFQDCACSTPIVGSYGSLDLDYLLVYDPTTSPCTLSCADVSGTIDKIIYPVTCFHYHDHCTASCVGTSIVWTGTEVGTPNTSLCPGGFDNCGTASIAASNCGGAASFGDNPTLTLTQTTRTVDGSRETSACSTSHEHEVQTLSDEYDTATLKGNVIAALPAYCGVFGCSGHGNPPCSLAGQGCFCSATYNLSSDETSFTLRRVKYKFTLSGEACEGLVVAWIERFIPTLTAGVTYMGTFYPAGVADPNPAHWTDTPGSYTFHEHDTESEVLTLSDPTANGTKSIVSITTNCEACPQNTTYGEYEE